MADNERINETGGDSGIGRQIVLPLRKAFEIAWKSIRIRIWRSLITTSGIILAIAFLMSVWASGALTDELRTIPEDSPNYLLIQRALQREAISQESITIRVGILGGGEMGESGNTVNLLVRDALHRHKEFTPFFLPTNAEALRREMTGGEDEDEEPLDAVVLLSIPSELAQTETVEMLRTLVARGGTVVALGYGQILPEGASPEMQEKLAAFLPAAPADETHGVAGDAVRPGDHGSVADVKWADLPQATYLNASAREDATKLALTDSRGLLWMGEIKKGLVFWFPFSAAELTRAEVLSWIFEGRLLPNALRWGAREKLRGGAMAKRKLWLVSLSLLVCIVGITNAMLMSVTERFREIGTMKCLGALDRFVVRLFLIESSFQGAAGSLVGAFIGLGLAFTRALFAYRITERASGETYWLAMHYFPVGKVLLWMVISIAVGIVLSVVAAIYPAYRAARMEPVDAMRVEA